MLTLIVVVIATSALYQIIQQKKLSEIKNDFINNISHEFKTPIATINLALDAISSSKNNLNDKFISYLAMIREENSRMLSQVENILRISQLEKSSNPFDMEQINIHEVIEDAIEHVKLIVESKKGSIKLFATSIRDSFGTLHPVEISAVSVPYPHACLGFTIREVGSRIRSKIQPEESITRSSEELTQLVGRLPLKEIINETTDLIEQLCIKAALDLTRGNRVSASEMLGLSRQSLYIKLRKYDLSDQSKDSDTEE